MSAAVPGLRGGRSRAVMAGASVREEDQHPRVASVTRLNDFALLAGLPDTEVIAIAGRNDALRRTLQSHHGYDHRVSVLGYSTQMRELLCGADAFVTTTAGSSPRLVAKAGGS